MDSKSLIARARAILTSPKTEWPIIAAEPATVGGIYAGYLVPLAVIPAAANFIKSTILGYTVPFAGTVRLGLVTGLTQAALGFGLLLAGAFVFAIIINELSPRFGGQKNLVQALKGVAYAFTAGLVASAAVIIPVVGGLIALLGILYGIYLLRLGLPVLMTAPDEKGVTYTGVATVLYIVLSLLVGLVVGPMIGMGSAGLGALGGAGSARPSGGDVTFDKDSTLGKLDQWSKKMEQANKNLEEAQKSGDTEAQQKAMGDMMGSIFSGGDQVESLAPERLKAFVPDTLSGLARTSYSAERNQAMGIQISEANASYSDGTKSLQLEITDMGSAKGLMGMASWAAVQQDKETDSGYERTRKEGGRLVHEQWDNQSHDGEYTIVVADRFSVKVSGQAANISELKRAADSIDLRALEGLKDEGVKKGG